MDGSCLLGGEHGVQLSLCRSLPSFWKEAVGLEVSRDVMLLCTLFE